MSFSFEYCLLSSKGLCDGSITRPEESYQVWCASTMRRSWPQYGLSNPPPPKKKNIGLIQSLAYILLNLRLYFVTLDIIHIFYGRRSRRLPLSSRGAQVHFPCPTSIKHCSCTTPIYTGCPRRNVPYFGRVFLMLKYTDITQNTYVQS